MVAEQRALTLRDAGRARVLMRVDACDARRCAFRARVVRSWAEWKACTARDARGASRSQSPWDARDNIRNSCAVHLFRRRSAPSNANPRPRRTTAHPLSKLRLTHFSW